MAKKPKLSHSSALKLAWSRGLLSYKLYDYQQDLYRLIKSSNSLKTIFNISRRYGKTTVLLLYCLEFAIRNKGVMIRFAAPTQKSLRNIVLPIVRMLIEDCPRALRPNWKSMDSCYEFFNGSELHIVGVNNGHEDDLRGQKADLAIIDEAGSVDNLDYLYRSILLPQCLTCNGRILIASTPPKYIGHDFELMCNEAKMGGNYLERTIYDNKSLSPELIARYAKESGGEDSVTFRREYLCKFETEKELLIVPEYSDTLHVKDHPKDSYFDYYYKFVAMDLGVRRHFTAVLFGYYDFKAAKLIIQDEFKMMGEITTNDIAKSIKEKEVSLWGKLPVRQRISDSDNPLLVNDLSYLHNLIVVPTNKDSLEAMVNEVRIFVGANKLVISPNCTYLRACLEGGRWKEKKIRQEFAESKTLGHMDGLAALVYLIRNLDMSNPIPHLQEMPESNYWINPENRERANNNLNQLQKLFGKDFKR